MLANRRSGRALPVRILRNPATSSTWLNRRGVRSRRTTATLEKIVRSIIEDVAENGDPALIRLTKKFDRTVLNRKDIRVSKEEVHDAYKKTDEEQISTIQLLKKRIEALEGQSLERMKFKLEEDGLQIQNGLRPIQSVGCYVPGGKAAYPSTVVMTTVPAKVAGVPRIVVCSPPTTDKSVNPLTLVAADICGVDEIYKIGGVQAIAALAYGTKTIKPVRKIVGPGNKYVTTAKTIVSKDIAVDMPAGPSEILIMSDETTNPRLVALDMISQAEHGEDSIAGLLTTSEEKARAVLRELEKASLSARRGTIVKKSLSKNGFIVICKTIDEMIKLANEFAAEHVEIMTKEPRAIAEKITSAGLILVGSNTPVSLTDYCIGTNHVLPTGGFAHALSGLSVVDFIKRIGIVECSKQSLLRFKDCANVLSESENLPNHYAAVEGRIQLEPPRQ
jgi:histidinol dehydrogenase